MKFSHRAFDALTLAGVASTALSLALTATPTLAQTPDDGESGSSVTIPADKIGVVGFTIRDQIEEDARGALEAVAECGIQNIEFSGSDFSGSVPSFQKVELPAIQEFADEFGFNVPSLGVDAEDLRERFDEVITATEALGASYVRISGSRPEEGEVQDASTYSEIADLLNEVGPTLKEAGVTVAYHNHDWEFEDLGEGVSGYDILLSETDPESVGFELDLYWAVVADADPVGLIQENPGRFPLFHVKDAQMVTNPDGTQSPTFATVGQGFIDFQEIFAQSDVAGVDYYFIENDRPEPDGITSTCEGLEYLTTNFVTE